MLDARHIIKLDFVGCDKSVTFALYTIRARIGIIRDNRSCQRELARISLRLSANAISFVCRRARKKWVNMWARKAGATVVVRGWEQTPNLCL